LRQIRSVPDRDHRAQLAALQQRCAALGIPLTLQRRAILEILISRDDHPTADEVFASLHRRTAGISKATVYRTLEVLVERGLVVRVCHPGTAVRYDVKTRRHHHLVCDACGRIKDFEAAALDRLVLPDLGGTGFRMRDFSVHVRGLCEACARGTTTPRDPLSRSKKNDR
jgi:Fe2+ or Zn2+ uptake regulation protein